MVPNVSSHYKQQQNPLGQLGYGAALLRAVGLARHCNTLPNVDIMEK